MSASRVLLSTAASPTNQERPMTMPRMPHLYTTTNAFPLSWSRRQITRLHGVTAAWRALAMLCALLVTAAPARAADIQTQPQLASTSPALPSALAVDVTTLDPKIVYGAPASLGQDSVESTETTGETVEFYGYDATGSVRIVFDPAGSVVGEAAYSPFGIEMAGTTGMPSRRFTGQERDHEAQLDYFNARYYQARTGRFSSTDPLFVGALEDPQRWNRYAYALNNPISLTDTSGLVTDDENDRLYMEVSITVHGSVGRPPPDKVKIKYSNTYQSSQPLSMWAPSREGTCFFCPDGQDTAAAALPALVIPLIGATVEAATVEAAAIATTAVIGAAVVAKALVEKIPQKVHMTYTLKNPITGQLYVGRTSGYGDPDAILKKRFQGHQMRALGYGDPKKDAVESRPLGMMDGYALIRAREQQVIDDLGGATRDRSNPLLGNAINGLNPIHPLRFLIPAAREKYGAPPVR